MTEFYYDSGIKIRIWDLFSARKSSRIQMCIDVLKWLNPLYGAFSSFVLVVLVCFNGLRFAGVLKRQ